MESKCNICLDEFDKFIKIPRILNCGHFFCQYCLTSLIKKQIIVCPNCRVSSNNIKEINNLPDMLDFLINSSCKEEIKSSNSLEQISNQISNLREKMQKYYSYIDSLDFGSNDMINTINQNYSKIVSKSKNYFNFIEKIFKDFKENIIFKLKSSYDIEKATLQEQLSTVMNNKLEFKKMLEKLDYYDTSMKSENINDNLCNLEKDLLIISQNFETISDIKYKKSIVLQNIDLDIEKIFILFDLVKINKKKFYTEIMNEELFDHNCNNEKNIHIYFFYPFPLIDTNDKKYIYRILLYDISIESLKLLNVSSAEEFNFKNCRTASYLYLNKIFLISGNNNIVFDSFKKVFKKKSCYPAIKDMIRHSLVKIDYSIFFIGGFKVIDNLNYSSNICCVYDVIQNDWTPLGSLNVGRYDTMVCTTNNKKIFVFGGKNEKNKFLDSIEYLDIEKCEKWFELDLKLPIPLRNASCTFYFEDGVEKSDKIFIFGGEAYEGLLSKVFILDVNKFEWKTLQNMQFPRYNNYSFYHNKCLYVLSGNSELKDSSYLFLGEKYSLQNDKWSVIENQDKLINFSSSCFDIYCVPSGILFD